MSRLDELMNRYTRKDTTKEAADFFYYFESGIEIKETESSYNLIIKAVTKISHTEVFSFYFDEENNLEMNDLYFARDGLKIVSLLLNDIHKNKLEEWEEKYQEWEKLNQERRRKADNDAFHANMQSYMKQLAEKEMSSLEEKIHIDLFLEKTLDHRFFVSYRLGRNKTYKIKDIYALIHLTDNHEFHSYGKDLAFTHYPENFDESAQKLFHYYQQNPALDSVMKADRVEALLPLYSNRVIYINEIPYLVSSEPENIRIEVRNDGTFALADRQRWEPLTDHYFIFDQNKIARTSAHPEIAELSMNIMKYPLADIHDVLGEYQYTFFERFPECFTFEEGIKNQIERDVSFKINTYFDFDSSGVHCTYKIIKNGKEKAKNDAYFTAFQKERITLYEQKITRLGFDETGLIRDQDKIWNFLNISLDDLKRDGEVFLSDSLCQRKTAIFQAPLLKINRSKEGSMLDVFMEESSYSKEELYKIYEAIQKKKKFILLKGEFIRLDEKEAEDFSTSVTNFGLLGNNKEIAREKTVPLYYGFKALGEKNSRLNSDETVEAIFEQIKNFHESDITLPTLNATLRPYQADGVKWLNILYQNGLGGILADDMGLGKTIETIAFIRLVQVRNPVLIVSPKSLLFNWMNEFQKFDGTLKVTPIIGTGEEREKIIKETKKNEPNIFIISYDTLRNDITKLKDSHFDTCILDEAQFIKNVNAKKTNAVKEIRCDHAFALTGTPIENNIVDLWSIFDFLMPNYFIGLKEFLSSFQDNEAYEKIVKSKALPFILRRNKKDVLKDLPPKYEVLYTVEMEAEQRRLYESVRAEARRLTEEEQKSPILMLSFLTRLRQICVDPSLYIENYSGVSAKMAALKEMVVTKVKEGHRLLIFSQFVTALNHVKTILEEMGISYFIITGETPAKERIEICNEFNRDETYKVTLISLKAGGTGLNLTGADTVIHLNPWWNIAAENQASDRAHRIGQSRNVEVIKLVCENSIEQKVISLQNEKKDLVNKIISDNDEGIKKLSIKDLKDILSY